MSSFDSLFPAQQQVLTLLAVGSSIKDAAEVAGVHRNTVSNWTRSSDPFRDALAAAQYEQALYWRDKLQSLAQLSITCLRQLLESPKTPPSILLRAAMGVLNVVSNPAPAPRAIEQLQRLAAQHPTAESTHNVHNSAQSPEPAAVAEPAVETSAAPAEVAIAAQSCTTVASAAPKTFRHAKPQPGRNDLCPCGSGEKYKYCCLDKNAAA